MLNVGSRNLHMLRLIGAFIAIGAALMILAASYKLMFVASVVEGVNRGAPQRITYEINGIFIDQDLGAFDSSAHLGLMMTPIAQVMFWGAVLVFGTIVYRAGFIIAPRPAQARPAPKPVAKTKGRRGR